MLTVPHYILESAADTYGQQLTGITLTGANSDGALGLKAIKEQGGLTISLDPNSADSPYMPEAAIKMTEVDHILTLDQIGDFLKSLFTF